MRVIGLLLVRNEVDVLEANLRHHFATLLDAAIVVDNASTDGSLDVALDLARELPMTVASEPGEYMQAELLTKMARLAYGQGADWVLPIDADEFWVARGRPARGVLEDCPPTVGVLRCAVTNFVQSRDVAEPSLHHLLRMTRRPGAHVGTPSDAQELVESGKIAFVEIEYQRKCLTRATPTLSIDPGNHAVSGHHGDELYTDEIECLHAPLRARSALTLKVDQGRRVEQTEKIPPPLFWHVRRWWQLARQGRAEDEWAANSYDEAGALATSPPRTLDFDDRLRSAVEPWIAKVADRPVSPALRLPISLGAYLLALDEVPGWFAELDFRIFIEIDELQRRAGLEGDLFEIGAYYGKSAILLGYLAGTDERVVVCDIFEETARVSEANRLERERWYDGLQRSVFEETYLRFHERLPEILARSSTEIDAAAMPNTCRFVHVDGSHVHAVVRHDIDIACALLRPGGVIALDDISTAHNPGSALAAWEAVLAGRIRPVCLTNAKLYGSIDDLIDWSAALSDWAQSQPDLTVEMHELAGYTVPRVVHTPPRRETVRAAPVGSLPPLEIEPQPPTAEPAPEPIAPDRELGLRELLRRLPVAARRAAVARVRARRPQR